MAHDDDDLSVVQTTPAYLGNVIAAASGTTVFRVDEDTGAVTVVSGAGVRTSGGGARALVTVYCGSDNNCRNSNVHIRVGALPIYINRGRPLTNLTVEMNTARYVSGSQGPASVLDFYIRPIGRNDSASFYVGMDFPIAGDDSGSGSGLSTASYYAYAGFGSGAPFQGTTGGYAAAMVSRGLGLSATGSLSFGALVRPRTGTGTAVVDADQGAYHNYNIAALPSPGPSRVVFKASGDPNRSISINIPHSFNISRAGGGGSLTVTVSSNAGSSGNLNGSGVYSFGVGGSINVSSTTPTGLYSGTFTVSVAYN